MLLNQLNVIGQILLKRAKRSSKRWLLIPVGSKNAVFTLEGKDNAITLLVEVEEETGRGIRIKADSLTENISR